MKKTFPFGEYKPDFAPNGGDGLLDIVNAYPTANGYRPVGAFSPMTDALPATFTGGGGFVASDTSNMLIAGTASGLYRFTNAGWVSLATGLSGGAPWQFTQFGDKVIGVDGGVTQSIDLIAQTSSTLTGAPTATSVATVRDFVVYGGAAGQDNLVQWSGFNDETANVPGTDQAGYQPMLDGGPVQGIAGGEYGIIIQRSRVVRMSYIGAVQDDVVLPWQFDTIAPNIGALAPGSIAQAGRRVFFLSDRGFVCCDGNDVQPIGSERVNKTLFDQFTRIDLQKMHSAIDPRRDVVAWMMPGLPAFVLLYNWSLDRWTRLQLVAENMLPGFTANVSIDDLDALFPGGIDSIGLSLDDARFAGGDPLLLIVSGNVIGSLSGANMAASFALPFQQVATERARVRRLRPLTDAVDSLTVKVTPRRRLGDPDGPTTSAALQHSGLIPIRASGRYLKLEMDVAAGAVWSYAQGLEVQYEEGGGR